MPKGFVALGILAVIFVLVLVVSGVWFLNNQNSTASDLSPTPISTSSNIAPRITPAAITTLPLDETTRWKVYKDKKITFRYPSEWNLDPPGGQELARFTSHEETIGENVLNLYLIDNYNQNTKKPFSSLEEIIIKWQEDGDLKTPKEIIVDGQRALWVKDRSPGHVPNERVSLFPPNKDSVFTFYFYYQQDESVAEQKIHPLFDQILSTFKFLN